MNRPADVSPPHDDEFEQSLLEVERSLQDLKERYAQVQQDLETQKTLQGRLEQAQADYRQHRSPALHQEIRGLKQRLEELDITLESQLMSWGWVRETFWQIVRFGGLGVVLGWLLRSWAQ